MDWAVQAARRKIRRVPGGSRSVVETLDGLNSVAQEGHARVDLALQEASEWLGKVGRLEDDRSMMVSPETSVERVEEAGDTPLRQEREVPSATPRSLVDDVVVDEPEKPAETEQATPKGADQVVRDRSQRRSNMFVPLPSRDPLVVQQAPTSKPVLAPRKQAARKTQSPAATGISRTTGSVFDRLSSLPTKSFENKVNARFAGRRISASSSIDVTGSPIRRSPPVLKHSGTETSIQDTLKNIFFAKDTARHREAATAARPGKNGVARPRQADVSRVNKQSSARVSPKNGKIPRYQVPNEKKPGELGDALFGPVGGSTNEKQSNGSPQKQVVSRVSPTKNKSKHQDRLTKFQLIPPVESGKDDVKEKLNKRLSEVMRTQQNQSRRRNEQQKRKSQLDEDFKRRTRIWNEMKESSFVVSAAVRRNSNITLQHSNTMLHDLNIVDHRTVIGGVDDSRHSTAGNQTLPEIASDSDDDGDDTLASWARSPYLQEQVHRQQNWDPQRIFGPIPPLHIDQIFPDSKANKLRSLQASSKRT